VHTLYSALGRRVQMRGSDPLLTWCGAGARAELSAVTLANAAAKTAALLADELDAEPGDRLRLDLGLHWQNDVWLAAADALGLEVLVGRDDAEADFVATQDPGCRLAGQRIWVSSSPLGLPEAPAPDGFVDHAREAIGQPDVYAASFPGMKLRLAGEPLVGEALWSQAGAMAATCGLQPGGRLGIVPESDAAAVALACLAVPLALDASTVLVADRSADVQGERITAWAPVAG
jgi:uncharacterized protein (TIGR03089 family)